MLDAVAEFGYCRVEAGRIAGRDRVGGYIGLEMADALTVRGLAVIQMEQLPEVLPTVDPELGALVHAELASRGVQVLAGTTVKAITRAASGQAGRLEVEAAAADGTAVTRAADLVLVVVGVRPDTALAARAGARLGVRGALAVDPGMRTGLPDVFGAGDCAIADPPLKLVLLENRGQGGSLNHLGVEVPGTDAVEAEQARLAEAGLASVDERDTTCCYARQDKFWVQGAPNGERWEIYTVLEDSATFWGQDGSRSWAAAEAALGSSQAGPAQTTQCCGGLEESGHAISG